MQLRYEMKRSKGALLWFFQRITGIYLFVMLLVHFFVMHFSGKELTYENVAPRLSSPLWKAADLLFLIFALYHGFNGLWSIIDDYVKSRSLRLFLMAIVITLVVVLFVVGAITILSVKA